MKKNKKDLYDCFTEIDEIIDDSINNALLLNGGLYRDIFETLKPKTTEYVIDYTLHQVKMHVIWKEILQAKERLQEVSKELQNLWKKEHNQCQE